MLKLGIHFTLDLIRSADLCEITQFSDITGTDKTEKLIKTAMSGART